MKKIVLALSLIAGSVFGIDLGLILISPEVGATLSHSDTKLTENTEVSRNNDSKFGVGGYARLWVGIAGFMLAPQVKYDYLHSAFSENGGTSNKFTIHNLQYGGVVGYRIPVIKLTPFAGVNYSTFESNLNLKDSYAINFGVRWEVPLIPLLVLGFEGSWQKIESNNTHLKKFEMLNLGGTIGIAF